MPVGMASAEPCSSIKSSLRILASSRASVVLVPDGTLI